MKEGYKCVSCWNFIEGKGSDVYIVKGMDGIYFPTCSIECGEVFKQKSIQGLQSRIDEIKTQCIEKETW